MAPIRDLAEIIKEIMQNEGCSTDRGESCVNHIHMYVAIPPKLSVSEFMPYLEGKSSLMFLIGIQS